MVDVVFLHGLDGDVRKSWSGKADASFWPKWLAEDVPEVAVWSVGYAARSTGWQGQSMPILDRAVNVMARLQNRGVGKRPLVFVAHSMGGLLVKQILLHAAEGRTDFRSFASVVRGVVFLGTPHVGANIARVAEAFSLVYRTTDAVRDLKRNSAYLRDLNDRYRDWVAESGIRNLVFFETQPTKGVWVVDQASANPGLVGVRAIPVDANHTQICKPVDRDALVYGQVKRFVVDIIESSRNQTGQGITSRDEDVRSPPFAWRLPPVNRLFVGRVDELARLDSAAMAIERVVVAAVYGLGGVGKSALVARWAHARSQRFSAVWWMTADSPTVIDSGLAALARSVDPEVVGLGLEEQAEAGTRWLASRGGWLLVLDNLTNPAGVSSLLQRVHTGTIIVTSRQTVGWSAIAETIALDVLSAVEAVDMLKRTVHAEWVEADFTGVDQLCKELGYLPLAIEQAAAYIAQTRVTPADYLDLLTRFPSYLFAATREGGDAQRTIARIWQITQDTLAATPLAGKLLRQLAWYAPGNISRTLLASIADEPDLGEALGKLAAYSMINLRGNVLTVHRLVQAVNRTPDLTDPHRQSNDITAARDTAIDSLNSALSGRHWRVPRDWPVYESVLPHVGALVDNATIAEYTTTFAQLLARAGNYLLDQGATTAAITYLNHAYHAWTTHFGPDHPDTLTSRTDLAIAYESTGDLARAISLFESALADRQRVLGSSHPDTLMARNNLAYAYESVGDLGRAISLLEETLADTKRILGRNHPDTLMAQNNLACAYESAGDLVRAISLYEETLVDTERVLGLDHPDALVSRNNLAYAYETAGDLGQAIHLFESTLADRERILGLHHPDTLMSRNNLANAYRETGDLGRAIPLFESTLADRERILGLNHPHTLTSRNNLAHAYEAAGDLKQAIHLFESTLADRERILGLNHPHTLTSRNNLAHAYEARGDLSRAIPLFEKTAAERERVLGPDHPDTLMSRNNLAHAYHAMGDQERATLLYEATLANAERVLGTVHPFVKIVRSNLETST